MLECIEPKYLVKMQFACKFWYEKMVPKVMLYCLSDFGLTNLKIERMLAVEPQAGES